MSSTVTEKVTLKNYFGGLSNIKLDYLYDSKDIIIVSDNKDKNIKKLINNIEIGFILYILSANKKQLQLIDKIVANKDFEITDESLIDKMFLLETDGNYAMPEELVEIYTKIKKQGINNYKKNKVLNFYIMINGIITRDQLFDLCKENVNDIKLNDVINWIKENNYIYDDNHNIYENKVAKNLAKNSDFMNAKLKHPFNLYSMETIILLNLINEYKIYEECIIEILEAKVGKTDATTIAADIKNSFKVGLDYEESIDRILCDYDIELDNIEKEKFNLVTYNMYNNTPMWNLNGSFPKDKKIAELNFFHFSTIKQIRIFVDNYLEINGAMKITKLLDILNNNHNYKISKNELIDIIDNNPDIIIIDDYVANKTMTKDTLKQLMKEKDIVKDYKIIENLGEFCDNINEKVNELEEVCLKYKIKGDIVHTLNNYLVTYHLTEKILSSVLDDYNITLSKVKIKSLLSEIHEIEKNTNKWVLNGFTPNEKIEDLINMVKPEPISTKKIGRNDLCSCGSGKKYKNCCGR